MSFLSTLNVLPTAPLNLDIAAISGICGSISIACWVVVFTPQILQNFRRSSTEGLSVKFVVVWLAGDVFNILGGVLQRILPTMLILAVYYTIADMVLLAQCFYYRGFTLSDDPLPTIQEDSPDENTPLIPADAAAVAPRRPSWTNLSPAVPLVEITEDPIPTRPSVLQALLFNGTCVLMVILAGIFGWFVSARNHTIPSPSPDPAPSAPELNFWGQIFGYLCAALYILSRIPQLILNYRRKSTDGLSMLFFLFACLGNITYVLSILAYDAPCGEPCLPGDKWAAYWQYVLVNSSWLAGSSVTLVLDFTVFTQYFLYDVRDVE